MNEENVPDQELQGRDEVVFIRDNPYFPRNPSLADESIIYHLDQTVMELERKNRANQLRRRFSTPPPIERIAITPPELPEMQFPAGPLRLNGNGMSEKDREELRLSIAEGMKTLGEAVRELNAAIGPAWREIVTELEKAFDGIRVAMQDLPEEHHIHPGELRDERGIKQPSHTPPFWVATPGRTSKKRGRR